MRRSKVVLALVLVVFSSMLAPIPAQADSAATILFSGKEVLSGPMCWSAKIILRQIGVPCAQANPKVPLNFTLMAPNPHTGLLCLGAAAHPKKTPPLSAGACGMAMTGVIGPFAALGPWCDLASGVINAGGSITVAGKTFTITGGAFTQWATLFPLIVHRLASGTVSKGNQTGIWVYSAEVEADATKGHSCVPGATHFIVTGALTLAITGTK